MAEPEVPLVPLRRDGGASAVRVRVRVGQTVRRTAHPWSPAVLDLLGHLERAGFIGAPRALGFDEQGREVLSYVEGEVGAQRRPGELGGGGLPDFVWRDDVLVRLGGLLREFHDAAQTFPWVGREWCLAAREPVETICHHEVFPWNTVFAAGLPVAFIDWDTAAPGPRASDLGFTASAWVPFWTDAKCRAAGLPTGVAEKARRFRLFAEAYGRAPDVGIVHAGIDRMRDFLEHMRECAADGCEWETALARRGVLDEVALDIAWTEAHASALLQS